MHGKQDRRDIDVYRVTTSYVGARAEAERIISEARNGRDPFISNALLKKADISTFEGLCRRYLEDPAPGRKRASARRREADGDHPIMNKELIPVWGLRDPNSIQPEERMEWSWIDREKRYLVLPSTVTKTKREHIVPLVPQAIKLHDMLKELAGDSPYVFPGPNGDAINWVQKACDRAMQKAGIEDGRHHGTRRVLQTNMAEMGVPPHVADMILTLALRNQQVLGSLPSAGSNPSVS